MAEKFVIRGGNHLKGKINVSGMKNAATPIIAATILAKGECIIENVPRIVDVDRMVTILGKLGAESEWLENNTLRIDTEPLSSSDANFEEVQLLRSSILLMGPLLARFGEVTLPYPGGCVIGSRPIDTHLVAFKKLGARIEKFDSCYHLTCKEIQAGDIILREFSVTATENLMMACALTNIPIRIKIAAAEPHVSDLASFLQKLGVKISGRGTHTLEIAGNQNLQGVKHRLIPDQIEAGTFAIAAAATQGDVIIENIIPEHLDLVLEKLREMNVNLEVGEDYVHLKPSPNLKAVAKIDARIYPGIPTDLQSPFAVLATQAAGTTLIFDTIFEGRLRYVQELIKMGANATICDPHRVLINGPTPLYGQQITSYDLRAGASLIVAALVAEGQSEIFGIDQVDRGYENIEARLRKLGADIKRVK